MNEGKRDYESPEGWMIWEGFTKEIGLHVDLKDEQS